MKVLFNDDKKILAVVSDDTKATSPCYQITLPSPLQTKLAKLVSAVQQKTNGSGYPLFVNANGAVTTEAITAFVPNTPLMETISCERSVGLNDSPAEWTVEDVLAAKYGEMANGRTFFYDEFMHTGVVDATTSTVHTGIFGISIPSGKAVQFIPLTLAKPSKQIEIYVESDVPVGIEASADGKTFQAVDKVAAFTTETSQIIVRLTNQQQIDVPVRAFAIFY